MGGEQDCMAQVISGRRKVKAARQLAQTARYYQPAVGALEHQGQRRSSQGGVLREQEAAGVHCTQGGCSALAPLLSPSPPASCVLI